MTRVSRMLKVMRRVPRLLGVLTWAALTCTRGESLHELPDMIIQGQETAQPSGYDWRSSLFDAIDALPSLQLSPQGMGAQTDISIRGSSFSEAGLSLSGLALRSPQTGHFSAECPLTSLLFSTPELLTGLRQAQESTGHFAGSIAADFAPITPRGLVETGIGERGTNWQGALFSSPVSGAEGWGATVFASRSSTAGLDYNDNDASSWNTGVHAQRLSSSQQLDLAAGYQSKQFGARGFYGSDPDYASEEELEDTLLVATNRWSLGAEGDYVRVSALWRSIRDYYVLDQDNPALYENWHRSAVATAAVDGFSSFTDASGLQWRVETESERLSSTRFADHGRRRAGLSLIPKLTVGALTLNAGGRFLVFSGESPATLALCSLEYALTNTQSAYVSHTQSVRQPSYTELYYNSTSSIGNADLKRQSGREFEIGWTGKFGARTVCQAALFSRRTRHTVDWVKPDSADDRWQATDLGKVDITGGEVKATVRASDSLRAELGYAYLHKAHHTDFFASRYVLDFPRQRMSAGLRWRVHPCCELRISQTVAAFRPNPVRTTDSWYAFGRLQACFRMPQSRSAELTFSCDNIWNDHFELIAGQESSGRFFSSALSLVW